MALVILLGVAACTPLREEPSARDGAVGPDAPALDTGTPDAPSSDAPGLDAGPDATPPDGGGGLDAGPAADAGPSPRCTDCLAAGFNHSCAIRPSGVVACWGANTYGQLGDGTMASRNAPVDVLVIGDAVQVAAGDVHTCALRAGGRIACWGFNQYGRLGDGTTTDSAAPREVVDIDDAVQVAAGGHFTCALRGDRTVWCWGANGYGQLGTGAADARSLVPLRVVGVADAVHIAAGAYHACAVRADGMALCWGANGSGQLGDGTTTMRRTPVEAAGIGFSRIACGGDYLTGHHTCAVRADGTAACWGANASGQLGDATSTARLRPTAVVGLGDAVSITAGTAHSCALRRDASLACWGANAYGRLGDATTTNRNTPTPVAVATGWRLAAAAREHTCALTETTAFCWGANGLGQLGNGSTTGSTVPVMVTGWP